MLLDAQKFTDCLHEDASLAIHIQTQVKDLFGDYCDIMFLGHEETSVDGEAGDQESDFVEVITGYDFEHGQPRTIVVKAIENNSITGMSLRRGPRGDGEIRLTSSIFANAMFNELIDAPLLPKAFLES